jgi:hypothetical protein
MVVCARVLPPPQASLKPRFQAKELDNDGCKLVLHKVVTKVMEATTGADTAVADFMTSKRVTKVEALVDSYVQKHRAGKKAEGGADAVKGSQGKVSATARTP